MLGISTTNLRVNGFRGKGLSTEAQAWRTNIIANGGTIPDATLLIFDNYFFKPAKANGNILSELDRLNIYCGLVGYEIAARTNVIKAAHYVTPVSSPTFDNNGYKSSGTSYLDLNYNPNTQGVKYTLNSALIGYGVKNANWSSQKRAIGCSDGVSIRADLQRSAVGSGCFINSIGDVLRSGSPSGNAFIAAQRTASNAINAIINTTETTDTDVSVSIPNFNAYELCLNLGGTPLSPFDDSSHLYSFHGSGNCDYAALRTIINNTLAALGV